jgi:hypothetical protein
MDGTCNMNKVRNLCMIFVGKSKRKFRLGNLKCKWWVGAMSLLLK